MVRVTYNLTINANAFFYEQQAGLLAVELG